MSNIEIAALCALVGVITFVWGFISGSEHANEITEADAIENGVGEYYLDENHNKQFRWKQ